MLFYFVFKMQGNSSLMGVSFSIFKDGKLIFEGGLCSVKLVLQQETTFVNFQGRHINMAHFSKFTCSQIGSEEQTHSLLS